MCSHDRDLHSTEAPRHGYPYNTPNQDSHIYPLEFIYSKPFKNTQHLDALHSLTFANEGQHYVQQLSAEFECHEIYLPELISYSRSSNDNQHINALHSLMFANEGQHYLQQVSADLGHPEIYGASRKRAQLVRLSFVKFLSPLTFWSSRLVNDVV